MTEEGIAGSLELIQQIVRSKAWALVGRKRVPRQDGDDLIQLLLVRVLERLPRFDPERGSLVNFVSLIVNQGLANQQRGRPVAVRDLEGTGLSTGELVGTPHERGQDDAGQRDRRLDLELLLGQLDAEERRRAETVLRMGDLQAAARSLGTTTKRLRRALVKLRRRAARLGLGDYLGQELDADAPSDE